MDKTSKYYLNIMLKFVIFAFIAFLIFIGYKLIIFYMPFLIAFIVASIAEPLIKFFMNKCKFKRKLASVISLLLILTILITFIFLIINSFIAEAAKLTTNMNTHITNLYNFIVKIFDDFKNTSFMPNDFIINPDETLNTILNASKDFIISILNTVVNIVSSVPTIFTNSIITILAIIFMCFDRDFVKTTIKKHVPVNWINKTKYVVSQMCSVSFKYIKAEAKLSGICFLLVLVGLNIFNFVGLKIDYPVIMAIVIGFVDVLPLFGAGVVMVPWALYLLFTGNIGVAIAVLALWIVWAVIKQLIEPQFVSKQMGLHPLSTLIAMYTGFKLFGILGLIFGPIAFLILKNVFSGLFDKGIFKTIFNEN